MSELTKQKPDLSPIKKLLDLIVETWSPKAIWLFGSRARGGAHPSSDWDLLVLVSDKVAEAGATDPFAAWNLRRRAKANADLIVLSEEDFEEDSKTVNTLSYEVKLNGITVYEQ